MKSLKKILLIDDSEADNYLHSRAIRKANIADNIVVMTNAVDALSYITTAIDGEHPCPEAILLDINMPAMTGWEFLDEYAKIDRKLCPGIVVCMLTASIDKRDRDMAEANPCVDLYITKPVTVDKAREIFQTFCETAK